MTDASPPFWNVEQIAVYYGISRRVVYHHISKGALPAIYIGGSLRVRREDVLSYGKPVQDVQSPPAAQL